MEDERDRGFEAAETSARSFASSLSANSKAHIRTFQKIISKYEDINLKEDDITQLDDWTNERESVSFTRTGLVDLYDPLSGPEESTPPSSPDSEFAEKARTAFLSYCKEPSFQIEESFDVDDCNVGLVTEVETDCNPVDSDEEVTAKSKLLRYSPFSRKRRHRLSDVTLSDDEGQSARSDTPSRIHPPRKRKKRRVLTDNVHFSGDGNEGDDEFEKACERKSNHVPVSNKEVCSLCVIEPEPQGTATCPLPHTLPPPLPLPNSLCSSCQPIPVVATACACLQCVGYTPVGGCACAPSEDLLVVDQVEYNTEVVPGVETSYSCHTAVITDCGNGYFTPMPGQPIVFESQETNGLHSNMYYSFAPAVQQCTCIDCIPLL